MYPSLSEAVSSILGNGRRIDGIAGVPGGDIDRAYRLRVSDGARLFMKCNAKANLPFFIAETEGLEAIASAGAIRPPAAYVGHAEADLAMTELFGGFPPAFYDAFKESRPLRSGYERRRDLYNLYHLLNHLNLFGAAYLDSVRQILREYR